jgi:hypothetical protein
MNSSGPTSSATEREPRRRRSDHPRATGAWKGLLWLAVAAVAVAPFPWW